MITIYPADATDFSTLGLGALDPDSACLEEIAGGMYSLELSQPITRGGRDLLIDVGRILRVPCPVRETPLLSRDRSAAVTREIYKVTTSGARLHLRQAASLSAKILGRYKPGTEVIKLGMDGKFMQVAIVDGGASGYMWATNLTYVRSETDSAANDDPSNAVTVTQAREQLLRIKTVRRSDTDNRVTVSAEHITYDLAGAIVASVYAPEKVAANTVVAQLLAKADHDAGISVHCDLTTPITGDYTGRNLIDCLLSTEDGVATQCGARVYRDNFDLWILPDEERVTGVEIRYGKNLTSATLTEDISGVITRILPMGRDKDGDPLLGDYVESEHPGAAPTVNARAVEYDVQIGKDDIKTEAQAKAKLQELAQADMAAGADGKSVELDVDFVRLELTPLYRHLANQYALHLYDTVPVIDSRAGINASVRMTSYTWDPLTLRYTETGLGEIVEMQPSVYGYDVADGSLGGTKLLPGSVSDSRLATGAVTARTIRADAVSADAIAAKAVTAEKLAAGAVTTETLAAKAVTTEKLAAEAVTAETIATKAVTTEKLAAEAVTADNIKAGAVKTKHLDAGAVTAEKIEAGSITADRMKAKTITAESGILADGVVGTAQIADGSITSAKIVSLNADVITAGTLSVKRLILVGEDGLIYNINAAASGLTAEELTNEKYQNQINGTVIVAKSITAVQIAAESITGNEILAGSITAGNIDVAGLFADEATIAAINAMDISSNSYLKLMVENTVNEKGFTSSYIEIRPEKIDVKSGGSLNVNSGDVDISTSKFSVSITDEAGSEDELLTIDATGVRAANLSAPNVAMRYDGPGQIIVNSGATSAQVESGGYARSIQEVFDRINDRFLPYTVSVTVQTDTYENLSLHGVFGGSAALLIDGGSHRVYGAFSMECCRVSRINVENLGVYCGSARNAVEIWNCGWVRFAGCAVEGYGNALSAFYIDRGSTVMLYNSEMYHCSRGIYAGWGTNVDFHTLRGECSGLYLEAYGTRITGNESRPSGGWSGFNIISNFADMTTIPIDTGNGVVAPTTGSASFAPTATGTYTTYWWNIDSDIRQGYTKSNGRIKGGIFYAISGVSGTVKSAILKLTRLKNYGKGAPVQVKVYGTVNSGKSGNPALSTEGYVLGTIDGGQTAEFALPEALAAGLGNGTYKGLVLYADDTTALSGKSYSTNYARFSTDASLTLTWTT